MKRIAILLPLFCVCAFAADPVAWRQADFAADLYRNAASAAGGNANVILSPWGVASLFGMIQTGARGDTARGMASALRLGADDPTPDETAATFRNARATIDAAANKNVELELSDSLWLAPGFSPKDDFLALVRDAFCAEARTTKMGETGRTAINRFVDEKTHGRIPELLSPGSLDDPLLRMVAVDTIYLKAKWENPFDAADTKDGTFRSPAKAIKTPFMHATRDAEILDAPECAALRLPYGGGSVEMLVVLPSPSNTLADVESLLGSQLLERMVASPWRGLVSMSLPKFEFDSTHDLEPILSSMGMSAAFSGTDADFSGIAPQICLSRAIQKANITVDEEGTEAAAATAAFAKATAVWPPPKLRYFVADRPFLFLIRETHSGIILFIGRVAKPAYSVKKAPPYKVKFNANGGKLSKGRKMATQKIAYDKAAKLRKNVFTRKGYVFAGWAKKKNGKVVYRNGASVKNLRTDGGTTTLYAVWAKEKYKVAFYGTVKGVKGKMTAQTFTYGKTTKLKANKFKRKGYTFKGWATSKANAKKGKVKYKNKAKVKNLNAKGKTVKLHAVWEKK